jgi:hypothetical protein
MLHLNDIIAALEGALPKQAADAMSLVLLDVLIPNWISEGSEEDTRED